MNPKARQNDLVIEMIMDEIVIYDLQRNKAHALNPTAAFVWQHCDGQSTPADLARLVQEKLETPQAQAEAVTWLSLDRLEKAHLLDGKVMAPSGRPGVSRRQVLKMAGVGIALLPVVATIAAPKAAEASSGLANNANCTSNEDCNSQCCNVATGKCANFGDPGVMC